MNTMDDIPVVLYYLWYMASGRDIFVPLSNCVFIVIFCGQLAFMNTMDDIPMVLYCLWCMVSERDIFVPLLKFL